MNRIDSGNRGQSSLRGPTSDILLWRFQPNSGNATCSPLIDSNGVVYFATRFGYIHGLYPSGSVAFKLDLNLSSPGTVTMLILPNDSLVILASKKIVYSFSRQDDKYNWSTSWIFSTGSEKSKFEGSPILGMNGNIYFGTNNNELFSLSREGSLNWKYSIPDYNWSFTNSPSIDNNGFVYFSATNQTNYWMSLIPSMSYFTPYGCFGSLFPNGTLRWMNFTQHFSIFSSPVLFQDHVYISYNRFIYALTPLGSIVWTFCYRCDFIYNPNERYFLFFSTMAISSTGIIYQTDVYYKRLVALNAFNGKLLWTVSTEGLVDNGPIIDYDGNVYVTNNYGYLISYSSQGSLNWMFLTHNQMFLNVIFSSSATIGPKRILFVGSTDGSLYAIGKPSPSNYNKYHIGSFNFIVVTIITTFCFLLVVIVIVILFYLFIIWWNKKIKKVSLKNKCDRSFRNDHFSDQFSHVNPFVFLNKNDTNDFSNPDTYNNNGKNESNDFERNNIYKRNKLGNNSIKSNRSNKSIKSNKSLFFPNMTFDKRNVVLASDNRISSLSQKSNADEKLIFDENLINSILKQRKDNDITISWDEISLQTSLTSCIIGFGSSGTCIRAIYTPSYISPKVSFEVAVKVMKGSSLKNDEERIKNYALICKRALKEVKLVLNVEKKLSRGSDNIVKMYGVSCGKLPDSFLDIFRLQSGFEGAGIVMRYESGGSLENLLHKDKRGTILPLLEKIRLLCEISRAIADIHSVHLIHGDLKPDNILLSDKKYLHVRLADFGLSHIKENNYPENMKISSFSKTNITRGTPVYCAPEMLMNPFSNNLNSKEFVAKASRKTDMYSFSILCWEVLTELRPFAGIKTETALCSIVHQGQRPDLDKLPFETPRVVVEMIKSCWNVDRLKRKTAIECASILLSCYSKMSGQKYDVQLVGCVSDGVLVGKLHTRLADEGICVCGVSNSVFDNNNIVDNNLSNLNEFKEEEYNKSAVMVMLLSRQFQHSGKCMELLKQVHEKRGRIVTVALEQNMTEWASEDLLGLCSEVKEAPLDVSALSEQISLELNDDDSFESFENIEAPQDDLTSNRGYAELQSIVSSVRSALNIK